MRCAAIAGFLVCCGAALAQTDSPPAGNAPMPGMAPAFVNPAAQADQDAMRTMMAGMEKPYVGDADQDFVSHMMPHHQAAIDMAEIELRYGSDPKLKQLAARIIAAQQHEIAFMQAWMAKHPVRPHTPDNPHTQAK